MHSEWLLRKHRCVVQVENPNGEDKVLMEKGLLVRMVRVKLAPDEAILQGTLLKRGGTVFTNCTHSTESNSSPKLP